jgi:hypothetical protein
MEFELSDEGTSQTQQLIIGRSLTGINALVPS